ncbi:MAG: thioredoxin family protein [Planctomycetota bacterium]|jgi:thiol:disulfide interchange protein
MRVTTLALVAAVLVLAPAAAARAQADPPPADPPKKAAERPPIYDVEADARKQIARALEAATRENRRVLIQWGANWCGWCHVLHDLFAKNAEVRRKLQYEYDVVLVDIGRWDKSMDLVRKYGADIEKGGVPYLTILAADGRVLANQETGSLEKKADGRPAHDPAKVLALLEKHQAPRRSVEQVYPAGLAEARATGRMVFLHFGAPWCTWCHRLERWMHRPEVAEVLARDFVDVKIDIDRMIGGEALMEHFARGRSQGIPWFAFLDADGTPIVTSEGPDGNIGCPHSDAEIAQFRALLRRVAKRMTPEDIERITRRLGPPAQARGGDGVSADG